MKTGILFDLDGTLLDTLEDLLDASNYALRLHGFPERTLSELRCFIGNGAENQIRCALPDGAKDKLPAVLADYRRYYSAHCRIKTRPYPGIPQALAGLGAHYPLAIVSNKPDPAVKSLCSAYFPGIYALGEIAGCPRKPAADMVLKAMRAISVERCVYVGDSEVDVLTAKNAGVPCLSVLWGFRDKPELEAAGGEIFCEKTEQLIEKIEELIHGK